jgi:hypothetical protein
MLKSLLFFFCRCTSLISLRSLIYLCLKKNNYVRTISNLFYLPQTMGVRSYMRGCPGNSQRSNCVSLTLEEYSHMNALIERVRERHKCRVVIMSICASLTASWTTSRAPRTEGLYREVSAYGVHMTGSHTREAVSH